MTIKSLGTFGKDKGHIDLTFGWFGHTIRVNPGAGELELMEFLMAADQIEVPDDKTELAKSLPAMRMVFSFLERQIHPDDWQLFFDLAKTNRQDTNDLMEVAMSIVTEVAGFPTTPPSDSPGGPPSTPQNSAAGSSSAGPESAALSLLSGRPDLQAAVMRAAEARAAAG